MDDGQENIIQLGADGHGPPIIGMGENQFSCMEQQAAANEHAPEQSVVAPVAVGRVAYDRMKDMLQVAAYLVSPAGEQTYFEK